MRGRRPAIGCDAEDGECGMWEVDYFEETVSTVNGVRITREERAPGWLSTEDEDFCPTHAPAPLRAEGTTEPRGER